MRGCAGVLAVMAALAAVPATVAGQTPAADVAAQLNPAQLAAYTAYLKARAVYDRRLDAYWAAVDARRDGRKRKRAQGIPFTAADYVDQHPPKYHGPPMPPEVARIIAKLRPPQPQTDIARVTDFLASAHSVYGFVPEMIAEREFKRRYADEALAAGLTKTHVVRVYALETGGRGTYDMQSGIDPETKTGRPISSALGYAQLLHANSVSELVKFGDYFIQRLQLLAAAPGTSAARAAVLAHKVAVLRKMMAAARTVPNEWSAHVRFAGTPQGLGIHALNLDGDIGPWLQVIKLRGLILDAQKVGRPQLSGAELELMNLAGPRTGLEMMDPIGGAMPTANFFSRGGYYRNPIVHDRTGRELLARLDERMDVQIRKAGSIEFAAMFDAAEKHRLASGAPVWPQPPPPGQAHAAPLASPAPPAGLARRPAAARPKAEPLLLPGGMPEKWFNSQ